MFKYGGPIREGIMDGMRNNYQSGQLVRPGPGRPGYQGEGFWQKLGAQYKPKNLFKWSRLNPFKKLKTLTKVPQIVKGIPKNLQGIFTQTGKTSGITGSPAATTFMQNLRSFPGASKIGGWATKAKDIALKYPKSTAAGVLYGGVPLATNLPYKKIASTIADIAVPDQIYNWETGRWFNSDDTDLKPSDKKILEQKKTEIVASAKPEHLGLEPYTDPDKAEKLSKAAQNKRLKSYLDMMGYDRSKRTAIGDALIDASAIVQEGTTEAGSLKEADWGKMINKAIQTTSRRLDKPEQIREAQKDLKGTSFFDEVSIAQKAGAGGQTATDRGARNVSADEGIKWRGNIINKEDFKDTFAETKEDTGLDDVTIVENWVGKKIDEGLKVNDGNYTVGDYLVTIKDSVVVNVR